MARHSDGLEDVRARIRHHIHGGAPHKTPPATILYAAAGRMGRLDVFAAAAVALVVATALNVAVGGVLRHYVSVRHVQVAAGIRFIVIGARTLLHG